MFETPSDDELEQISYFVAGTVQHGEEYVRTLDWSVGLGSGELTYDTLGRSVRVTFQNVDGGKTVDIIREGAFRLTFVTSPDNCEAVVDFGTESLSGVMRIQMIPELAIHDSMLLG